MIVSEAERSIVSEAERSIVSEAERSIVSEAERSIVSEAERLRLGRSSGGNTAGQPSDDGCYENGKASILEHG
jgi:hypothetical protein